MPMASGSVIHQPIMLESGEVNEHAAIAIHPFCLFAF
jgi:hypothetical protein